MRIEFDHGPQNTSSVFQSPTDIVTAHAASEVSEAFGKLEEAQAEGFWVAGYASYELGYALENRISGKMPNNRRTPLMRFGVYREPATPVSRVQKGVATLGPFQPRWSESRYTAAFERLHSAIGAGDIYQGNLTFPMDAMFHGDPAALYQDLAGFQPVGHGALVLQDEEPSILSRSPERFFQITGDGTIVTRPMKGTQPRSINPAEDAERIVFLRSDEKNRAENLMIVDLLRNDISRICVPGSVRVPQLFEVETYATVHQMVSEVRGQVLPDAELKDMGHA